MNRHRCHLSEIGPVTTRSFPEFQAQTSVENHVVEVAKETLKRNPVKNPEEGSEKAVGVSKAWGLQVRSWDRSEIP